MSRLTEFTIELINRHVCRYGYENSVLEFPAHCPFTHGTRRY